QFDGHIFSLQDCSTLVAAGLPAIRVVPRFGPPGCSRTRMKKISKWLQADIPRMTSKPTWRGVSNIDCIDDVALFIKSKTAIATHVFPLSLVLTDELNLQACGLIGVPASSSPQCRRSGEA